MIATATVGHFMSESRKEDLDSSDYDVGHYGRLEFFLFTTSFGMIIVMIVVMLAISEILEKINLTQAVS